MSMGPTWNQGAEPPPAPKSGSKTWLILGVVIGVCVLVCCGGGVAVMTYFGSQFANLMSFDPVEVRASQAKIVDMTIPDEVPPRFRFNLEFVGQNVATLVYFGGPGNDNLIWFAQAGNSLQAQTQNNPDELRSQLETQLVAQTQTAQAGTFKGLTNTDSSHRDDRRQGRPDAREDAVRGRQVPAREGRRDAQVDEVVIVA
jgi:hypothetical protein